MGNCYPSWNLEEENKSSMALHIESSLKNISFFMKNPYFLITSFVPLANETTDAQMPCWEHFDGTTCTTLIKATTN